MASYYRRISRTPVILTRTEIEKILKTVNDGTNVALQRAIRLLMSRDGLDFDQATDVQKLNYIEMSVTSAELTANLRAAVREQNDLEAEIAGSPEGLKRRIRELERQVGDLEDQNAMLQRSNTALRTENTALRAATTATPRREPPAAGRDGGEGRVMPPG